MADILAGKRHEARRTRALSKDRSRKMKKAGVVTGLLLAGLLTTSAAAQDKPLIVYVSPNPLGVNDFLKLGKAGTEKVAAELGADVKTFESAGDPTTQRQ